MDFAISFIPDGARLVLQFHATDAVTPQLTVSVKRAHLESVVAWLRPASAADLVQERALALEGRSLAAEQYQDDYDAAVLRGAAAELRRVERELRDGGTL